MKVLLVDPDGSRVSALREALTAAGAEVAVAPSGAFALTMLERNPQDAIVSRARIEDMEGHELCAILRSDPEARDVRFVLVAGQDDTSPAHTADAGIDLVVPPSMNESLVLRLIVQLVSRDRDQPRASVTPAEHASFDPGPVDPEPALPEATDEALVGAVEATLGEAEATLGEAAAAAEPADEPARDVEPEPMHAAPGDPEPAIAQAPPEPAPEPAPIAPAPPVSAPPPPRTNSAPLPSRTFQGSLGVMGIEELTQAIAVGGKTGRLILALGEGGGLVAFESGRVVHAEFGDTLGEEAFAALLAVSLQERSGKFCFIPSDAAALAALPKTIAKSVDQLLLSVAAELDARAPTAAHTSAQER
jgi:CheY-like chemotaxis protein